MSYESYTPGRDLLAFDPGFHDFIHGVYYRGSYIYAFDSNIPRHFPWLFRSSKLTRHSLWADKSRTVHGSRAVCIIMVWAHGLVSLIFSIFTLFFILFFLPFHFGIMGYGVRSAVPICLSSMVDNTISVLLDKAWTRFEQSLVQGLHTY